MGTGEGGPYTVPTAQDEMGKGIEGISSQRGSYLFKLVVRPTDGIEDEDEIAEEETRGERKDEETKLLPPLLEIEGQPEGGDEEVIGKIGEMEIF